MSGGGWLLCLFFLMHWTSLASNNSQGGLNSWCGICLFKILFPWALASMFVDYQDSSVPPEEVSFPFPRVESRGFRDMSVSFQSSGLLDCSPWGT